MKKMIQSENNFSTYPSWVCGECAMLNGGKHKLGHIATFHNGKCGWCGELVAVTQPADYGFPIYDK